jgi:tetrahydromethanopterin S-methyltransferase subunit G
MELNDLDLRTKNASSKKSENFTLGSDVNNTCGDITRNEFIFFGIVVGLILFVFLVL